MSVVGVDLLIFGGYSVKGSVACFWWTDVVLQTDIDHNGTGNPGPKLIPSKYASVSCTASLRSDRAVGSREFPGMGRCMSTQSNPYIRKDTGNQPLRHGFRDATLLWKLPIRTLTAAGDTDSLGIHLIARKQEINRPAASI